MRFWRERDSTEDECIAPEDLWPKHKKSQLSQESQAPRIVNELILQLGGIFGDDRIDYEERAAIIEYDGGILRREAECLAFDIITAKLR